MTISHGGTLPVSSINLGLEASVSGLQAEVTKLEADLSDLAPAVSGKVTLAADLPADPLSYTARLAAETTSAEIAAQLTPGGVTFAAGDANVELVARLGLIDGQLAIVQGVTQTVGAGLAAGELAGWSYAGGSAGFGEKLDPATASGFGATAPGDQIQAVIIATESFASWQAFSGGMNTGTSSAAETTAGIRDLRFMGILGGADWNTGTADLFGRISLFLDELEAAKANIEAQIGFTVGADLPEAAVIAEASAGIAAELGIDGLLANFEADVDLGVDFLNAKIEFLLGLIAEIGGDLSAGGLTIWTYTGSAGQLGAALRGAIVSGLPGGSGPNAPIYGLVIAGPAESMLTFGSIFKTS